MLFAQRQAELALRREALCARSDRLRVELADRATVLRLPLRLADGAWRGWRWVKTHPDAVVAGVVVVVVVRPRRAWTLARWTWRSWRAWRKVRFLVDDLRAGFLRAKQRIRPDRAASGW